MADIIVKPPVINIKPPNTDVVVPIKNPPIVTPADDPALPAANAQTQFNQASGGFSSITTNEQGVAEFTVTAKRKPQPTQSQVQQTRATNAVTTSMPTGADWRIRLSLASKANYLYNAPSPGILKPLANTNGVVFPYTPSIQVSYAATYEPVSVTHSNYKILQYQSSAVDSVSITGDFTAQDNAEAAYLLAVIHFFRSVTKMFYGKDNNPTLGLPPPLCFLHGLGSFQFDKHPLVITAFTYSLPEDVDYIQTVAVTGPGVNRQSTNPRQPSNAGAGNNTSANRLSSSGNRTSPGGVAAPANFTNDPASQDIPTYVPTRMKIQISAMPVVSRNDISNTFSLKEYANGSLLRKGIW